MSRAKPSNWRSMDLSKWTVGRLYPDSVLAEIFKLLRSKIGIGERHGPSIGNEKERTYARNTLLRIARDLNCQLHQRSRPTSGAQRRAIRGVLANSVKLRTALNQLDPSSRQAIRSEVESLKKEVEKSKKRVEKFPAWDDPESGLPGGDIVKHSVLVATHLERIVERVLKKLPGKKDGRVGRYPEREAVRQLRGLWSRYHDSTDDAAFWEFVKIVFEPLEPYGAAVPSLSTIRRNRSYQVAQQTRLENVPDDVRAIVEAENERLPEDVRTKLPPKPLPGDDVRAQLDAENERRRQSLEYAAPWNPRAKELLARFPTGKPGRQK
jgi:hypothetical protein